LKMQLDITVGVTAMFELKLVGAVQGLGFSALLALGMVAQARAQAYPPYGPDIPVITNTEGASGAYNMDLEKEPAPNPWNQESIWNMRVEGYNDNQADLSAAGREPGRQGDSV
jgi:hypothetical protein